MSSLQQAARTKRRGSLAAAVGCLVGLCAVATALATAGGIRQHAGKSGCISETGDGPCVDGHGLAQGVDAVAISPDGRSLYATTYSGLARLDRKPSSGAVSQPDGKSGCVSATGAGQCAKGRGLKKGADSVAVSPDGKYVYVAAYTSSAVTVFKRDRSSGAITQLAGSRGCISEDGAGSCANGHGLSGVSWITVSADGRNVYATATKSNAVVRFTRDKATGAITQPPGAAGCISDGGVEGCTPGHALVDPVSVVATDDGKNLYVASLMSNALDTITRDPTSGALSQPDGTAGCISATGSGTCATGRAISGPFSVAASADGNSVYVASTDSSAVARLARSASGALTQPAGSAGCISEDGSGPCADGHGLSGADAIAVSADDRNIYVVSGNAVVALARDKTTGSIAEPSGEAACVSDDGSGPCADGHALKGGYGVAVSRDGKSVYTASLDSTAIVRFNRN